MPDLEQKISEWRKDMLAAGIKFPVPLEELESHLREEIERQVKSGASELQALEIAARQIGQARGLKTEFLKARIPIHLRLKRIILTLAGVPNHQLATNMNTANPHNEPRWATYAKAGTLLFPAMFLWLFTIIFVLPKANEVCQPAAATVHNYVSAFAIFNVSAMIEETMVFLTSHGFLIGGVIVLTFILLERYFDQWPHYRRAALGIGAFLLNAMVLLSLTTMMISILLAASLPR